MGPLGKGHSTPRVLTHWLKSTELKASKRNSSILPYTSSSPHYKVYICGKINDAKFTSHSKATFKKYMYLYLITCMYMGKLHVSAGSCRVQKRALDPLELELKGAVNHFTQC